MGNRNLKLSVLAVLAAGQVTLQAAEPIDIGSRRELFVDDFLIDDMQNLSLRLHEPVRRELVFAVDAPWEHSNVASYGSIVQDGDRYLLYYRAGARASTTATPDTGGAYILCVAESNDGIHWTRPEINTCAEGPNVVLDDAFCRANVAGDASLMPAATTVILDTNPQTPPDQKFKMLATNMSGGHEQKRFYLLSSADGLNFQPMQPKDAPLNITSVGDSQNTILYDAEKGVYRIYHRTWDGALRTISTCESNDLRNFSSNQPLRFQDDRKIALYTNGVLPYPRAPHLLLAFPTRYEDFGEVWDPGVLNRPGLAERAARAKIGPRYGTASTDLIFMSSRDGVNFYRFPESFVRPGPERKNSWVYGDNEFVHGIVTTKSDLGNDAPDELSIYTTTGYWSDGVVAIRRHTLRQDGFVSLHAQTDAGTMTTKPLIFSGGRLSLNASTGASGRIKVGLTDASGRPIPGYTLDDCYPVAGDDLDLTARWKGHGGDLRTLAGQVVRLQFALNDADLYSFKFEPYQPDPALPGL